MSEGTSVLSNRNRKIGLTMFAVALGALGLGYAAVPAYRIFCQQTGFGGTPLRASEGQSRGVHPLIGRMMSIRFDSNVQAGMPWAFRPEKPTKSVTIGQRSLVFFDAENLSDHPITGRASYDIQPDRAASYFVKIQCFCFSLQTLAPHQKVRMPVIFYVDPRIVSDPDVGDVQQITLSYTFHPVTAAT